MLDDLTIRAECCDDYEAVYMLHATAFGEQETAGDAGTVTALVVGLRQSREPWPTISLVAELEGDGPVGHVMLSHVWVDAADRLVDAMVLSPLAVLPSFQKRGFGSALIVASLKAADEQSVPLVFLEGNPRYYGPRGFEKATALGFRRPSVRMPEGAFQVFCLDGFEPSMTGTLVYRDVHWRHGVGLYPQDSETVRYRPS